MTAPAPGGIRIELCGRVRVLVDGADAGHRLRGRQGRLLLAALVLRRPHALERDALVELLWPDGGPQDREAALRSLLSHLRCALGPEAVTQSGPVALVLGDGASIDVDEEQERLAAASAAMLAGDLPTALVEAQAAAAAFARPLLPDLSGPLVEEARRRRMEGELRALALLAETARDLGGNHLELAESAARTLVSLDPFREPSHLLLCEVLERRGAPAAALQAFEALRTLLREELGAAPGPAARVVHARLLAATDDSPGNRPLHPAVAARRDLAGRATERARLVRELGGTGRLGATALVRGEAGAGKTTLLLEAARAAHDDGAVVLHARVEERAGGPLAPWVAALGPVAEPLELDGEAVCRETLVRVLDRAACAGRVVVVLDDLHLAGADTLDLVLAVRRRRPGASLALLLGFRDAPADRTAALDATLAALRAESEPLELTVGPIEEADVPAFARVHGLPPVGEELAREAHRLTAGHALCLRELLRGLVEPGGTFASPRPGVVPQAVCDLVAGTVAGLSEAARALLEAAAVVAAPAPPVVIGAVAGLASDEVPGALDALLAARLLREGRDGVAFDRDLTRASVAGRLPLARRAVLHRRAADVLSARHGTELAVARHRLEALATGSQEPGVVDAVLRGGRWALETGAPERAAALAAAALEALSPADPDVRGRLLELEADAAARLDPVVRPEVIERARRRRVQKRLRVAA